MKTLVVPCAGKSSRFPDMKPKYLLTHPDGSLMVQKSLSGIDLDLFDNIIITIVEQHDRLYEAKLILEQVFDVKKHKKYSVCVLDDFTNCQAETVIKTIERKKIKGEIVIKDSDNYVKLEKTDFCNAVVGLNIEGFNKEVNRLTAKSFLKINDQGFIVDIIEKKINSNIICLGVYYFSDVDMFVHAYNNILKQKNNNNEIYVSHIVSYLIGLNICVFKYIEANDFEDWGTLADWRIVQEKKKTYFIDLDGVLLNNRGKYGSKNWSNSIEPLSENLNLIKKLCDNGAQIIITTSRDNAYREQILKFFEKENIKIHSLVMECNHSCRVIINDFAPTNPYPSCSAINIKRNGKLVEYFP